MKLGEIIKNYRKSNNLSMQEFADRCHLSKGYISMLERGKHPQNSGPLKPSLDTLKKIAIGMNTNIDTLVSVLDMGTLVTVNDFAEEVASESDVDRATKILFQTLKGATEEEILQAAKIIEALKKK